MNGVTAEIAEEIGALFEDDDFDAGAREENSEESCRRGRRRRYSSGAGARKLATH